MHSTIDSKSKAFIDGSRLMIESSVRAGADVFIGYPITPSNLLYLYASKRFPTMLAAPDEITTLQWMSGFALGGHVPITATSFPGYALMIESINMAYMQELPMVIILVQRLGPATGTATCGAQGDLSVVHGTISGGYAIPTLCISNIDDCWTLSAKAVEIAIKLRTPVVLLSSKEMVMTLLSYDWSKLPEINPTISKTFKGKDPYLPYAFDESLVPDFLPISQKEHQVRITASTHDTKGILKSTTIEAIENTKRLQKKMEKHLDEYTFYEFDEQKDADTLIVSYDITAQASREAVKQLRLKGKKVSFLAVKTLFPIPHIYIEIANKYPRIVIAEENLTGQLRQILFGVAGRKGVTGVNGIAKMISPIEIVEEVLRYE
jgi:2-oxoglutarate/2-oxoacid ferredoxin oxidoreductase subunit alpha